VTARKTAWLSALALTIVLPACSSGPESLRTDQTSGEIGVNLAVVYVDLIGQLCLQADCGPGPLFLHTPPLAEGVRGTIRAGYPQVEFVQTTDDLIDAGGDVRDGGRILHLQAPVKVEPGLVTVDASWERSRFEGKGETFVYSWDANDHMWRNTSAAAASITVTTAVP